MSNTAEIPNGNTVYPWKRWSNGKQHKVTKGTHFSIEVSSFRNSLTAYASRHGLKVTTRVKGNIVTFQFSKVEVK